MEIMASDQPAMTARSRLPVAILLVLCTGLSVMFYLRVPFGQMQEIVVGHGNPIQRHLLDGNLQNITKIMISNSVPSQERPKPDAPDFKRVNGKEQTRRKAVLRDACKKYNVATGVDIRKRPPPKLYVDDEHKVLYCAVPKIACTSWKKVFLVLMKSFKTTADISQFYANREGKKQLKELKDCSPSEIDRILKTYTKFLFARHPFSRVLSAFKNKLSPDSTFERAILWQKSVGKRIMNRYRDKDHPGTDDVYDLTFNEFVRYLIDPEAASNNLHWSEIYRQCLPCDIDYDIIGKFETLQADSKYILDRINAKDVAFPGSDSSSPTGSSNQSNLELHFKNVPLVDLQKLYDRFKIDFALFGYDPPTLAFKGG